MKPLRTVVFALYVFTLLPAAYAETPTLPQSDDPVKWQQLGQLFAECSAVYNLAATLKEAPDNSAATYRELANSALVAGIYSTEHAEQTVAYLESFYKMKYDDWKKTLKGKGNGTALLNRAQKCLDETLALQNQLVGTVRTPTAAK